MIEFNDFFRVERFPHVFCPGCGNGTVMNCFYRAFRNVNMDIEKTVFVGGIGCASRIPLYINSDLIHTTHGRGIPFAIGIKLANPELNVIVFGGDGDIGAIGGNHLINGCRRNVDLTIICVNNYNYGMTGGQVSTTTPHGFKSTTTPAGNPEYPFDLSELAAAAGANFVARWTVLHVHELVKSIEKALKKKGFSFVEAVSTCPVGFGRKNMMSNATQQLEWLKKTAIRREKIHMDTLDHIDLNLLGHITIGEFADRNRKSLEEIMFGPEEEDGKD